MIHAIHQEIEFHTNAERIFSAYTNADQHAAFTGAPGTIDPSNGGVFSVHNGMVLGRNIEIVENQRIVQAWRVADWPEGDYSIVKIELQQTNDSCTVLLDHRGFPDEAGEHLDAGWHKMYWEPLRTWLQN